MKIALIQVTEIYTYEWEILVPRFVQPKDWFDIKKEDFPVWQKYVENKNMSLSGERLVLLTQPVVDQNVFNAAAAEVQQEINRLREEIKTKPEKKKRLIKSTA